MSSASITARSEITEAGAGSAGNVRIGVGTALDLPGLPDDAPEFPTQRVLLRDARIETFAANAGGGDIEASVAELVSLEAKGRSAGRERLDEAEVVLTFADGSRADLLASRVHDARVRAVEIDALDLPDITEIIKGLFVGHKGGRRCVGARTVARAGRSIQPAADARLHYRRWLYRASRG